MKQAINFNDLKQAFAPKTEPAMVTPINKSTAAISQYTDFNEELAAENSRLQSQHSDLQQQLQTLEQTHQASITQLRYLAQENLKLETDMQNIHQDKMRLVRSLAEKQVTVESLKRELNELKSTNTDIQTKLSHSKRDIQKQSQKTDKYSNENKTLMAIMKQMSAELAELKKQNTAPVKLRHAWLELISNVNAGMARLRAKQWPILEKKQPLQWQSVHKALPKTRTTVTVRNGGLVDMAVYYPQTKTFKTVQQTFEVLEWAPTK